MGFFDQPQHTLPDPFFIEFLKASEVAVAREGTFFVITGGAIEARGDQFVPVGRRAGADGAGAGEETDGGGSHRISEVQRAAVIGECPVGSLKNSGEAP